MIYRIVHEEPNSEECKLTIKEYEEQHQMEIVIRQLYRADEERAIQDQITLRKRDARQSRQDAEETARAIQAARPDSNKNQPKSCWANVKMSVQNCAKRRCSGIANKLKQQCEGQCLCVGA
jgi:hypothetical protein